MSPTALYFAFVMVSKNASVHSRRRAGRPLIGGVRPAGYSSSVEIMLITAGSLTTGLRPI